MDESYKRLVEKRKKQEGLVSINNVKVGSLTKEKKQMTPPPDRDEVISEILEKDQLKATQRKYIKSLIDRCDEDDIEYILDLLENRKKIT